MIEWRDMLQMSDTTEFSTEEGIKKYINDNNSTLRETPHVKGSFSLQLALTFDDSAMQLYPSFQQMLTACCDVVDKIDSTLQLVSHPVNIDWCFIKVIKLSAIF